MENNFQAEKFSEKDALEFSSGMYKVKVVLDHIQDFFKDKLGKQLHDYLMSKQINIDPGGSSDKSSIHHWNWFDRGIECEALKVGAKGWQKGKVRLKVILEFIPAQSEDNKNNDSSLDEIRQQNSF